MRQSWHYLRMFVLAISGLVFLQAASADESDTALVVPSTGMITITTGGGARIAETSKSIFGKPEWKMTFREGEDIATRVNERLSQKGYNVEVGRPGFRWRVEVGYVGDAQSWVPPKQGNENRRAAVERGERILLAVVVGAAELAFTRNVSIATSIPMDGNMSNSPNIRYVTGDMLKTLPPGATKIALIRVVNEYHRAHQEVLTVGYGAVTESDVFKASTDAMLELLGIDGPALDAEEPTKKVVGVVPGEPVALPYTVVRVDAQSGFIEVRSQQGNTETIRIDGVAELGLQDGDMVTISRSQYGIAVSKTTADGI